MGEFNKIEILAKRYSNAIMKLANTEQQLDKFHHDFLFIESILSQNPNMKDFLEHPSISKDDKKDVLAQIFGSELDLNILSLLKLLIDNNRVYAITPLIKCFNSDLDRKRNIITTQVTTAIEVDENRQGKLVEKLEKILEKKVKLKFEIDKDIIAGMIVKIDDKVIDGSIKTKLNNLKRQLT